MFLNFIIKISNRSFRNNRFSDFPSLWLNTFLCQCPVTITSLIIVKLTAFIYPYFAWFTSRLILYFVKIDSNFNVFFYRSKEQTMLID